MKKKFIRVGVVIGILVVMLSIFNPSFLFGAPSEIDEKGNIIKVVEHDLINKIEYFFTGRGSVTKNGQIVIEGQIGIFNRLFPETDSLPD